MTLPKDAKGTILALQKSKEIELPIKTTTKILTQTEGRGLKQNTRANRGLIEAVMFGYPFIQRWPEDTYVPNMLDDLMCLSISIDGKGREEQIQCLSAGGQLPDAYYNTAGGDGKSKKDTAYLRYDADEQR